MLPQWLPNLPPRVLGLCRHVLLTYQALARQPTRGGSLIAASMDTPQVAVRKLSPACSMGRRCGSSASLGTAGCQPLCAFGVQNSHPIGPQSAQPSQIWSSGDWSSSLTSGQFLLLVASMEWASDDSVDSGCVKPPIRHFESFQAMLQLLLQGVHDEKWNDSH
jgi:hypothetical protein